MASPIPQNLHGVIFSTKPPTNSKDDPIAQVAEEVTAASRERSGKPAWSNIIDEPPNNPKDDLIARGTDENPGNQEGTLERLAPLKDMSNYGSAIRRSGRNVKIAREAQQFRTEYQDGSLLEKFFSGRNRHGKRASPW
ncbi:MAG: hypothetical protein FRX48_01755 [Lasallia pustulata]|uniref:Uncharacterized protein n=1 Tax=Lasallia pustulata TaxID=136370 RepID=A0A5M8Q1Y7_9LECA|nr:MAG: hypothetical protein FRX48_01755 [Lasallia pustulata]